VPLPALFVRVESGDGRGRSQRAVGLAFSEVEEAGCPRSTLQLHLWSMDGSSGSFFF
jgi:hypothetical protein